MAKRLEIHPDALDELAAAAEWYRARSVRAVARLIGEIDAALASIAERPGQFARYDHGARKPGYWSDRSF